MSELVCGTHTVGVMAFGNIWKILPIALLWSCSLITILSEITDLYIYLNKSRHVLLFRLQIQWVTKWKCGEC